MLESSRNQFDESTFSRIKKNILCASDMDCNDAPYFYFYGNSKRGVNNGYSEMNPEQIAVYGTTYCKQGKKWCAKDKAQ